MSFQEILELKKWYDARREEYNFDVSQTQEKFERCVEECRKAALTTKTASENKRFQENKQYGSWFSKLLPVIRSMDSAQPNQLLEPSTNELFQKKSKEEGGWGYTFLKITPGSFRFVTLPLDILEKTSFHSWKICKIVCHTLEFPRSKTKTHCNFTWVFLEHRWKFYFFFNWFLKFSHAHSSIPLEIFWNSLMKTHLRNDTDDGLSTHFPGSLRVQSNTFLVLFTKQLNS